MMKYIARRLLIAIPMLIAISIVSFVVIKLPPGDYLTNLIQERRNSGRPMDLAEIDRYERRYGLNEPTYKQYLKWVSGFPKGDFGQSFEHERPVLEIVKERIGFTVAISIFTVLFTWAISIPIGIYSAVRQYSIVDYLATFIGFIGMAVPGFLLALVIMFLSIRYFGTSVSGLVSSRFIGEPWSWEMVKDMMSNIWVPVVVVGLAGTAGNIRVLRAQMLDELGKDYVRTGLAKGLSEWYVTIKHAFRIAINPLISTIGWILPGIMAGDTIVGVVLSLPTIGPALHQALRMQDMYLAGTLLLVQSALVIIGTLISDVLLAAVDPRIRFD
ncbi:MAG: ABC transporter permease [Firmicutes bacterium]|nr:ABC transporter permease [Bacillota bacterium]